MSKSILVLVAAGALVACGSSSSTGTSDATSSSAGGSSATNGNGGAMASGGNAGTGGAGQGGGQAGGGQGGQGGTLVVGGNRPATVFIPPGYHDGTPAPLLMMLHGYSATGDIEEAYLQLEPQAKAKGFVYVHPDGTVDQAGEHFWNATDACCNFYGSNVDDDGYLMGIIDEISHKLTIDPKRVYVMGHSNGGFMTYRLACNHADKIAAVAVLAGEMVDDVSKCQPSGPVSLLHVQGTADATINYNGGTVATGVPPYPGATTSVGDWVGFDTCNATADTSGAPLDLDSTLAGAETDVTAYHGCASKTDVVLWTINGGSHIPSFTPAFAPDMTGWLLDHKKP
jgi:polyhydroxybutyrate depolymerase